MNAKYYLIGEKLKHSYSSLIHRRRGYDYQLKEIEKSALADFFETRDFDGLNVTVPYKSEVMRYLDEIDLTAKRIGAVNTVVKRDGRLIGYNTDIFGLEYTLKKANISVDGKTITVFGSGGASKTAVELCSRLGAKKIYVVSRMGEWNYSNCYSLVDTEVIFNCTPVGTYPLDAAKIVDVTKYPTLCGVVDLTYNPPRTQLTLDSLRAGVRAVNGLYMLVAQAFASERIFDGKDFTEDEIDAEVDRITRQTENIVLIGASGSGKTTVGRVLGAKTDREVLDTDEIIARNYRLAAGEIIERYGEEYFREIEANCVDECCQRRGVIVATGGGAVLREENRSAMRRCGKVVWIDRDPDSLTTEGRPLAEKYGAKRLYEMRKPIYSAISDIKVENNSSAENCAEEVLKSI